MTHDQDASPASAPTQPRQTTAYLKQLFTDVGFTIDARRGQNFLVDLNLIDLLERSAGIGPQDVVLEVGTGTGVLTERLSAAATRVVTCEIDPRLAQLARDRLIDRQNVTLIEGDVLAGKHRFAPAVLDAIKDAGAASPVGRFLLVANLPYCVATPVISNLLALPCPFDAAVVTVQREMAERLIAPAGTSSYNALSVWVGAQCRGEIVRILPPTVFWPRPKVDSAILRLDVEPERRATIADLGRFHSFVRDVFCHRRKLLRGVMLRMAGGKGTDAAKARVAAAFTALGLGPEARAEEISPEGFVALERVFNASGSGDTA
jgi:16S rRNA (adenine1518-N6/adenine1519-N6)-dimethyltransferase